LVLILWGYIIYRVVDQAKPEIDLSNSELPRLQVNSNQNEKKSYQLLLDYQDPFLKSAIKKNENSDNIQQENQNQVRRLHTWNWPNFTYNGCIQNHKKVVGLLQMNSRNLLVQEGKIYEEFKVFQLFPDSIIMEREGEKRTIVKHRN
jgi:Tfp pilus assembly protein PilP